METDWNLVIGKEFRLLCPEETKMQFLFTISIQYWDLGSDEVKKLFALFHWKIHQKLETNIETNNSLDYVALVNLT